MHPVFLQAFVDDKVRQARGAAANRSVRRPEPPRPLDEPIALRLCRVHDEEALARLAQLEGRELPGGILVVAELAGSIVAALPLEGGAPLADPFRATAQILPLLELRAAQLRSRERGTRHERRAVRWLASRG
jgi:hypothetical protein